MINIRLDVESKDGPGSLGLIYEHHILIEVTTTEAACNSWHLNTYD